MLGKHRIIGGGVLPNIYAVLLPDKKKKQKQQSARRKKARKSSRKAEKKALKFRNGRRGRSQVRRRNKTPKRKRGWCSRCRNTDQDGITVYNLKIFGYNWHSKEAVKSIRDIIHLLRQAEPIEGEDPKWKVGALCAGTQSVDSFELALGKSDTLLVYKIDDAIVGFFLLDSATCSRNLICSTVKGVGGELVERLVRKF